jgi:hypothetical protein
MSQVLPVDTRKLMTKLDDDTKRYGFLKGFFNKLSDIEGGIGVLFSKY